MSVGNTHLSSALHATRKERLVPARKQKGLKGKATKREEPQEQETPIESMLASLQESITGLTQKYADMEKTMATQQEEAPMAQRKQTSFEADEIESHFVVEVETDVLEIGTAPQTEGTLATTALEKELDNSAIAHYFSTEDPEGEETTEPTSPGTPLQPTAEDIEQMKLRIAMLIVNDSR